jgi:hypothetical protein
MTTNARDPLECSKEYLTAVTLGAVFAGLFSGFLLFSGIVLAEFATWILSMARVSVRVRYGYTTSLILTFFVRWALSLSPTDDQILSKLDAMDAWVFSVLVSLGFIAFAFVMRAVDILKFSYTALLVLTFFIFCYSEMFASVRKNVSGSQLLRPARPEQMSSPKIAPPNDSC